MGAPRRASACADALLARLKASRRPTLGCWPASRDFQSLARCGFHVGISLGLGDGSVVVFHDRP